MEAYDVARESFGGQLKFQVEPAAAAASKVAKEEDKPVQKVIENAKELA